MRPRFALAPAALFLVVLPAGAFERNDIQAGDTVLGDILVAHTVDEYPIRLAAGSALTMTIGKAGTGGYRPSIGLYTDDYAVLGLTGIGPTTVRSEPLGSGRYRVLVAGQGASVGAYRLRTSVKPAASFAMSATAAAPATTLRFGAYPDFDATVAIRWKGDAPVTLASVTGPDGAELTSAAAPRTTASTFTQGGFRAAALGDHVVSLNVPEGTRRWSASVRLSGRLPRGTTHDYRTASLPGAATVGFPSFGRAPIVSVLGESGGPNDCLLSATGAVPDAAFLDGGAGTGGCSRSARDPGDAPTKYLLFCVDGFFVDVVNLTRDAAGRVAAFEAPSIRSPQGTGSATLSNFTYDSTGRATGWTEVRRFDATGRTHTLVVSGAQHFSSNGIVKAFRVVHTPPDGVPRTYDYAPFR